MKQKFVIPGTLVTVVLVVLGMVLVLRGTSTRVHATGDGHMSLQVVTPIFQDNFDSYTAPGPLPTGTGATQWTTVLTKGAGAVSVSNTVANSLPNSLQITLGVSSTAEYAYAKKTYSTSYTQHAASVAVYLDPSLKLTRSITLFATRNSTNIKNGSFSVVLAANKFLQVVWYTSTGKKLVHTTSSQLTSGQWYTIELDQTNSATAGAWRLYLTGTLVASRHTTDTGSLPVDTFIAGETTPYTSTTSGFFYEDDVVTATGHI
jgi:hypothetical protein